MIDFVFDKAIYLLYRYGSVVELLIVVSTLYIIGCIIYFGIVKGSKRL